MDHGELHYYKEDRGMNHYVIDISHNLLNLTPLSSTTNWVTYHFKREGSLNCFSVTGQLYDLMSDGKIEKETIIEYSTNEGESFIALVLFNDEKEVIVSQELWFTFLNTAFNGEIRDNFPFLEEFRFPWPEDFKKCSGRVSK